MLTLFIYSHYGLDDISKILMLIFAVMINYFYFQLRLEPGLKFDSFQQCVSCNKLTPQHYIHCEICKKCVPVKYQHHDDVDICCDDTLYMKYIILVRGMVLLNALLSFVVLYPFSIVVFFGNLYVLYKTYPPTGGLRRYIR